MSGAPPLVLSLAPVAKGIGVFVIDETGQALDWRVRQVRGAHKNQHGQAFADKLMDELRPAVVVIEDHRAPGARRHERICTLLDLIAELGEERNITVARYGLAEARAFLALPPLANHDAIAAQVAKRLPVLRSHVPKPRPFWENPAHKMAIFTAAALALTHLGSAKNTREPAF